MRREGAPLVSGAKRLAAVSLAAMAGALPMKAQNANIWLVWNQDADPTVAGYVACIGPAVGDYSNNQAYTNYVAVQGDATLGVHLTNLQYGATYRFTVVAYDSIGEESDPAPYILWAAPPTPMTGLRIGYDLKREERSLDVANPPDSVPGLSPSIWSILDPLLDSRNEVASRNGQELRLRL